ncbi:MAG: hypothetical protein M3Y21_03995 [Candidatus Eremiobacteraeota bacterium]|nr:hypothetical protein [Candidatus Eremiobacteraeota bacterium]
MHPYLPNHRLLFVGANHNGGKRGLQKTPQMARYNAKLLAWAHCDPGALGDMAILDEMRAAYETSWKVWGAVWGVFGKIRSAIGLRVTGTEDDQFSFVNLARCPNPEPGKDNECIKECQKSFPLSTLVKVLDARVIFLAKDDCVGKAVTVPGEYDGSRLVIRYSNHGTAKREGVYKDVWIKRDAPAIEKFMRA